MLVQSAPSSPAARPSLCLQAADAVTSVQLPGPGGTSPLPAAAAEAWRPEQSQGFLSDHRTARGRQQHAQAAAAGSAAGLLLPEGGFQEQSATPEFWGSSSRRRSQSPARRPSASQQQQQQWQAGQTQQGSSCSSGRAERPRQPSPLLAAARAKAAVVEAQHHCELALPVLHTACKLLLSCPRSRSIATSAFQVVAGSSLPQQHVCFGESLGGVRAQLLMACVSASKTNSCQTLA